MATWIHIVQTTKGGKALETETNAAIQREEERGWMVSSCQFSAHVMPWMPPDEPTDVLTMTITFSNDQTLKT